MSNLIKGGRWSGVIKGLTLTEKVDLSLDNTVLSFGFACPMRGAIFLGNTRLATDDCVAVADKIKSDGAKCIVLIADHAKHSGIKHLMKIILWAVRDQYGNRVLKYLCFDINKSCHLEESCTKAIKNSMSEFEFVSFDISSIEIRVISGDTGDDGEIQHMHPTLMANKKQGDEQEEQKV